MERWLPIPGFEGFYEVSDAGNVRSLDRVVVGKDGKSRRLKGGPMTLSNGNSAGNYLSVMLSKDGKQRRVLVHRAVAMAFVPNPEGLNEINHKDENGKNNDASNLEWCDRKYNNTYGSFRERMKATQGTAVLQFDHGVPIAWFCSQGEASRATGAPQSGISACLRGVCKSSGGFEWRAAV